MALRTGFHGWGRVLREIEIRGGLSIDHLVTVGETPCWYAPGGPGLYASLGAAMAAAFLREQSSETSRVSLTATLPPSALAILQDAGIDVNRSEVGDVPLLWILNSPQGRRILSTAVPGGSHELDETGCVTPSSSMDDSPSNADVLLRSAPRQGIISSPHTEARKQTIVCVDPDQNYIADQGWDYLIQLASSTSVFLPSRVQLSQLSKDPVSAAYELREKTERAVVARLDHEGCLVLPTSGKDWLVSAPTVRVIDTTGAGDSHAGAFAAALPSSLSSTGLLNAAIIAAAVVGHTLSAPGAQGLRGGNVTDEEIAAIKVDEQVRP